MKKNKLSFAAYIYTAINVLAFSGCDIINPPEDIPAYIHIKNYNFTTNSVREGTAANRFTDAWVYAGNTFLGGFEIPTTIPSLVKGNKKLIISPGVKENGISLNRVPYPFIEAFTPEVNLHEAKVDTIKPDWKYLPETRFPWLENFEGTSVSLQLSNNSTTGFRILNSNDSAFEGSGALMATVDQQHVLFECQTKNTYQLPRGKPVWVEMHYKTQVPLEIGVYSIGAGGNTKLFTAGVNPSAEWNKVYFNLTSTISYEGTTQVFRIYMAAFNQGNGGTILIDNLKLLYLE